MTTMPADVAAWIRDHVLTATYRRGTSDPTTCDCQAGPCSYCQEGQHRQCVLIAWGGAPPGRCETYIVDRAGYVAAARGVHNEVWRTGQPCRWICPCDCTPIGCEPPPASEPAYQLDLFALLNPNRSTT